MSGEHSLVEAADDPGRDAPDIVIVIGHLVEEVSRRRPIRGCRGDDLSGVIRNSSGTSKASLDLVGIEAERQPGLDAERPPA